MRKFAAIVLICLLAFNWYGYRLMIHYFENRSDLVLQDKLNKQEYADQELVELRVPLHLPYLSDWKEFESFEGETTINGHHYRYVKRKLEKGELVLLCIPNQHKDNISKAGDDYFKQVNDLPVEKKAKSNQKVLKSVLNDFCYIDPGLPEAYTLNRRQEFSIFPLHFSSFNPDTPLQPPNAGCI